MLLRHSCTCAKLLQPCPTLCDPMDCSPPGSSVHGILQTAGGCHFLLQEMVPIQGLNLHLLQSSTLARMEGCVGPQSCPALSDPMDCGPPDSSVHGDSPGKNTGVGCHALLQGIFPTQGSNSRLIMSPALQVDSLPLVPPGKPLFAFTFIN